MGGVGRKCLIGDKHPDSKPILISFAQFLVHLKPVMFKGKLCLVFSFVTSEINSSHLINNPRNNNFGNKVIPKLVLIYIYKENGPGYVKDR